MSKEHRPDTRHAASDPMATVPFMLARIEGQVRGIRLMIEADRPAADTLLHIHDVLAALRAAALQTLSLAVDAEIDGLAAQMRSNGSIAALRELIYVSFRLPAPKER